MAKPARASFVCQNCGVSATRWTGKCASCGEWNTLVEETDAGPAPGSGVTKASRGRIVPLLALRGDTRETPRILTGMPELERVTGGGLVPASALLIGGEPGIGKSTLLLQVAAGASELGRKTLYVSAEESGPQVRLRAERLGASAMDVGLLAETSLDDILATAAATSPALLIIDSIQTIHSPELEGAPGNVGQVRECAARLMRFAKASGCPVFIVGHVTKGGGVAGPKTLEHIVDTVLYFEGDASLDYRVLRATKNRFGSVDEIGVFRMTSAGLEGVENPSAMFMGDGSTPSSGTAVTCLIEGTRPVLVEIQALAAKAGYGTPQRVANGVDPRRLALLLAVLEKRSGIPVSQLDVFVNVAGGLRLSEPAGDLAIAAAIASSVYDVPLPLGSAFIGELGLGGEIRAVTQLERRLAEAAQSGLSVAHVGSRGAPGRAGSTLRITTHEHLGAMFASLFRP